MNFLNSVRSNLAMFALGGAFMLGSRGLFQVKPGEQGLIYNYLKGDFDKLTYREGYHWRIPYITEVIKFDTRSKNHQESSVTANRDLQEINFEIRVLYKPDSAKLKDIYRRLGPHYADKVLSPIIKEVAKTIIAQYNAQELLSQREQVSADIKSALRERLSFFDVLLDEISITQLSFSKEYEKAIEEKQIAQQTAERMKYVVEKAKQVKKSYIIAAEGEVQALSLLGQSLKDSPAFIELFKIETSREVADILSKAKNKILLDSNSLLINNLANDHTQKK